MKLSFITEATIKWSGPLKNILGDGSDWSVNYGTSDLNRPPMLYIQIPLKLVRSVIRKVEKKLLIWAENNSINGECLDVSQMSPQRIQDTIDKIYKKNQNTEVYLYPELTHVGESHITITMGAELEKCMENLKQELGVNNDMEVLGSIKVDGQPLFDNRVGLKSAFTVHQKDLFKVFRAPFYKDSDDPTGPMLVALNISPDLYSDVRIALGLPPRFVLPNGVEWTPHVTLGFIPKGNNILDSFMV